MSRDPTGSRTVGRHLLADCAGVPRAHLDDARLVKRFLREAARRAGATIVDGPRVHRFPGGGLTGFVMLAESHVAIHTYPESGYCAVDAFTCGTADPARIVDCASELLGAKRVRSRIVARRRPPAPKAPSG